MNIIQLEAKKGVYDHDQVGRGEKTVGSILRDGGVRRIHPGWYTVTWSGVDLALGMIGRATRNRNGEIA